MAVNPAHLRATDQTTAEALRHIRSNSRSTIRRRIRVAVAAMADRARDSASKASNAIAIIVTTDVADAISAVAADNAAVVVVADKAEADNSSSIRADRVEIAEIRDSARRSRQWWQTVKRRAGMNRRAEGALFARERKAIPPRRARWIFRPRPI